MWSVGVVLPLVSCRIMTGFVRKVRLTIEGKTINRHISSCTCTPKCIIMSKCTIIIHMYSISGCGLYIGGRG